MFSWPHSYYFFCSGCIDIISNFLLAVAELEERYWLVDFLISSFASFYQQPCILYFETEDFSLWCLQFTARNMKMCAFDKQQLRLTPPKYSSLTIMSERFYFAFIFIGDEKITKLFCCQTRLYTSPNRSKEAR